MAKLVLDRSSSSPALLVDTAGVAALLGCSKASVRRYDLAELLPPPVMAGGLKRWRFLEVVDWIAAGLPARSAWTWKPRSK